MSIKVMREKVRIFEISNKQRNQQVAKARTSSVDIAIDLQVCRGLHSTLGEQPNCINRKR